jgi:hypothetical protein
LGSGRFGGVRSVGERSASDLAETRGGVAGQARLLVSLFALLAIPVLAGAAIAMGHVEVALLLAAAVAGWALYDKVSLASWVVLILLTSVAIRLPILLLHLPDPLKFLHYPLVVAFAFAAANRPTQDQARPAAHWLLGLLALTGLSMVANLSHPLRAVLFVVLLGEPLLVVWAVLRWGADSESQRRVGLFAAGLVLVQLPLDLWQLGTFGLGDPVSGTLMGSAVGAHLMGSLFALTLLIVVAAILEGKASRTAGLVVGPIVVGVLIAADAKQVLVALAVALVGIPLLFGRRRVGRGGRSGRSRLSFSTVMMIAVAALGLTMLGALYPGIFLRMRDLATPSQLPETKLLGDRARSNLLELAFGSGPGTSASRASLLLVDISRLPKNSPRRLLELPPTPLGVELAGQSRSAHFGGSAESSAHSILGILGDLGLVGVCGFALLFVRMWKQVRRSGSWLAPAACGALVMTTILIFIDGWLEFPEFALPLAFLLGFAMSRTPGGPARDSASACDAASLTGFRELESTVGLAGR